MGQKIVFGLTLPVAQTLKETVEKEMIRKFPDIQSVCRYRREGIYQYVKQQEDTLVIMEEYLQGRDPYPVEELQKLTDLGNNRIIFLMDHSHAGDDYVKALYCCGIYDGLYLDEASPKEIVKLARHGRTSGQARDYYGIRILRDAEKEGDIVDEERIGAYLEYLEAEADRKELGEKYRFVSTRLGAEENRVLASNLAKEVAGQLRGNEVFEFYKDTGRGKRFFFQRGRRAASKPEPSIQQDDAQEITSTPVQKNLSESEDEIFGAIDRFWSASNHHVTDMEAGQEQTDLLLLFGGYLKIVDT